MGAARGTHEIVEQALRLRPRILVLDLRFPDGSGLDAASRLANLVDDPPRFVVVSGVLESRDVYRAVELGACGVYTKRVEADELGDALLAVAGGRVSLGAEAQELLLGEVQHRHAVERAVLTDRERKVLQLVADGAKVADVARQLFLSISTVKTHLESTYRKLGAPDRTSAVARAMRDGLIT